MSKTILITKPEYDYTTRYLFAWSHYVAKEAIERGDYVVELERERANRQEFESVLEKIKATFIIFQGHGNETEITGQDSKTLVKINSNDHLFAGKIIYALSCRSALLLGKKIVKKGAKAYIGYVNDFVFYYSQNKRTRPLEDKTAQLFLESSNQIAISLIKRKKVKEAYIDSQRAFKKNILNILASSSTVEEINLLPWLMWDMNNQVYHGDGEATL